jgi:hypothetical protein
VCVCVCVYTYNRPQFDVFDLTEEQGNFPLHWVLTRILKSKGPGVIAM